MIEFNFKGISVSVKVEMERYDYKDANNRGQTRFNRNVLVIADFWSFVIDNDLSELAMVKSTLNYFMQAYWKRSNKEGGRIDLAEMLEHGNDYPSYGFDQKLAFVARQKNKRHFLEITMTEDGKTCGQLYLNGREVIMLDIAIAKAISQLSPETIYLEN